MSVKFTSFDINNIISLYRDGNSVKSIAKKYSVTDKVIRKRLTDNNISINTKFNNVILPSDKIVHLYQKGVSVKRLASDFNVSRNVIYRYLGESNIPLRNRSESMYVRMSNTPKSERKRLAKKAHDAVRGRKIGAKEGTKKAIIRENNLQYVGRYEKELSNELLNFGIQPIPQKAIHIYNVDLFTPPSICMEIHDNKSALKYSATSGKFSK